MKLNYDNLLTYDLVYDLYIKQRLSSIKIAEKLGVSKPAVLKRLKKFGLTREMQLNTYIATQQQKDLIVGSALGDGTFKFEGINYRMSFRHAENQKEYLEFKLNLFKDYTSFLEAKPSDWNYVNQKK